MQKLSGQDALFLHLDREHAASHVTVVYVYDQSGQAQPLRFRQIVEHLEQRLEVSPIFKRKIVQTPLGLAYPYWADDAQFDIDFHVRHFALPKPGDWRQFEILAARIHARPIDLTRSPWEMYVIEGLDQVDWLPASSFALITKIHHAAVDGTAVAELTWALHDVLGAGGKTVPVLSKQHQVARLVAEPTLTDILSRIFLDNLSAPLKLAGPIARVLPRLGASAGKLFNRWLDADGSGVPVTRFNQVVSAKRVFESVVVDLAVIKRFRSSVKDATVNDAVLAIVGGALRRYLEAKGELPEASLVALAPVNTRQSADERQTSGNTISFLTFPLASNVVDPIERLRVIQERTAQTKSMSQAIGASDLTNISKHAPPATLAIAARMANRFGMGGLGANPLHNCTVTNVPGPTAELSMLGARLSYFSGVAPISDGLGAVFAVSSLNGRLFISLTSCPEMVPDPAFFGDCIRASVAEADIAAAGTQPAGRAKPLRAKAPAAKPRKAKTPRPS